MNVRQLLFAAAQQLATSSDSPRFDAEILLAHSLGKNRLWLITWPEESPQPEQLQTFQQNLQRRLRGEPIAHITGSREFWSLPLIVSPDTLIPRPETELLIDTLLQHFAQANALKMLDLGTGSRAR